MSVKGTKLSRFIFVVVVFAFFLFGYVVLLSEIKRMNREKISKQEALNERINRVEVKMVDIQKLTSENRIVKLAQDSLGLVRQDENLDSIIISKELINQIQKMINEKYD
jgi:phosphopantetheine adenylyltransferase